MKSLSKPLRNELARTVLAARKLAEAAAGKALHALGVDEADAPGHLDTEGRLLRRRLRAQARQLGDREDRQKKGCYEIGHLTEKIAYDHWHRLLFARFLAENDLLISPDHGVGVSLADCEELAPEIGLRDGWEVAARFAVRMLPEIFRADDPAGSVAFAPEDRVALRKLVTDLPLDTFMADDALGWVYQFWQAQRKDEVNKSGNKIGADEIAPVTQLFTEDYMVLFLLHNTLGAWWAGKQLTTKNTENAKTEDELRQVVALPGVNWEYLRFVKTGESEQEATEETEGKESKSPSVLPVSSCSNSWRVAAGTFEGWPKTARELRLLDPSMGSGHFLVFELPILVAMRMAEEGLSREDAVAAVLRENLFGLEIDPRCTQIAAFNLALAAWKLIGEYRQLPPLNLACCGLGINARKEDWLKLAGDDTRLSGGMEQLFDLFQKAPELGSLINPRRINGDLLTAEFHELMPLLEQALAREETRRNETLTEIGVTARGLAHAAEILAGQFTLVATNVPYLGRGKQDDTLKDYCLKHHPDAKADLATCFIERCLAFCKVAGASSSGSRDKPEQDAPATFGTTALVTPQNWLFLGTYKKLREKLLKDAAWHVVTRLGEKGFDSPQAAGAFTALLALTAAPPNADHAFAGCDVAALKTPDEKAAALCAEAVTLVDQKGQLGNPDARVTVEQTCRGKLLAAFAVGVNGMHGGDALRFRFCFWEVTDQTRWHPFHGTQGETSMYSGREHVFFWSDGGRCHRDNPQAFVKGEGVWGRSGVAVSMMRTLPVGLYTGDKFDISCTPVVPNDPVHLPAIWCFCSSPEYSAAVRRIDQKLNVTNATLVKVPFDLEHWQKVAAEKFPNGLPKPHSDDPTQWLFYGHPNPAHPHGMLNRPSVASVSSCSNSTPSPLQVAVARLLGYRWPRQTGSEFPDCPRLGPDGLEPFADADGIVCLNAIKGEQSGAERLRALLTAAWESGEKKIEQEITEETEKRPTTNPSVISVSSCSNPSSSHQWIASALSSSAFAGKTLDDWLRNGFFEQHCQLFHQRPFIWQVWDGLRDGFSALVNYHKLDRRVLEKLIYTYLGDWIARQKAAVAAGEEGSDAKLAAAQKLKDQLEKILEGEAPYDIFVRWKPPAKQPIGWEPDLNDGVRLNIRPFVEAGILRKTPKIHWRKDRGKDVPSAPWYKLFQGDRINDHHLTLKEKREARERVEG